MISLYMKIVFCKFNLSAARLTFTCDFINERIWDLGTVLKTIFVSGLHVNAMFFLAFLHPKRKQELMRYVGSVSFFGKSQLKDLAFLAKRGRSCNDTWFVVFEIRLDDLVLFHVREFRQARVGFTFARIGSVTKRLRFAEIIAFLGPSGFVGLWWNTLKTMKRSKSTAHIGRSFHKHHCNT